MLYVQLILGAAFVLILLRLVIVSRRILRTSHCPVCGYDIRQLPSDAGCPECGTERPRTSRARILPLRISLHLGLCATIAATLFAVRHDRYMRLIPNRAIDLISQRQSKLLESQMVSIHNGTMMPSALSAFDRELLSRHCMNVVEYEWPRADRDDRRLFVATVVQPLMGTIRPEDHPFIRTFLSDHRISPGIRAMGIRIVERCRHVDTATAGVLRDLAACDDDLLRRSALRALCPIDSVAAAERLAALLDDNDDARISDGLRGMCDLKYIPDELRDRARVFAESPNVEIQHHAKAALDRAAQDRAGRQTSR